MSIYCAPGGEWLGFPPSRRLLFGGGEVMRNLRTRVSSTRRGMSRVLTTTVAVALFCGLPSTSAAVPVPYTFGWSAQPGPDMAIQFDHNTDSCQSADNPDIPVRAFRFA